MTATWILLIALILSQTPQAGGGVIAGEIRLPDGGAAAGVRVGAMAATGTSPETNGVSVLERITETDESGRYRLENVAAGRYYILAGVIDSPIYYPGTSDASSARVIIVAPGSNLEAMDFTIPRMPAHPTGGRVLPAPFYVTGRIVIDNGRPWPQFLPSLYIFVEDGTKRTVTAADGVKIRGSGTFGATPVSKDGSFNLFLANGEYRISLITSLGEPLNAADGYHVKSISSNGADLLKQKLRVDRSTRQTIEITLIPVR